MSQNEAERLLSEARHGSRDALGQILDTQRNYLLSIAQTELGMDLQAKGGASDLVQDTFLEAQRDFQHFGGASSGELRAWLRQLLLHHVGKFARRYRTTRKRRIAREFRLHETGANIAGQTDIATSQPSPSDHAIAHEQADVVKQALQRLPEDYQRVITLRYQEHHSFDDIGRIMGRSVNAVRKLWARAVEQLQHELEGLP